MTRALVLGGGGPVGIAWEAGLVVGLQRGRVMLAEADAIIGTSAGAAVGAQLALGVDLAGSARLIAGALGRLPLADATEGDGPTGAAALLAAMATAAQWEGPPEEARQHIGRMALESATISEDDFIALFDVFAGMAWPDGFACTAVDARSGELVVWDRSAGIDLQRAVASSCAVPGMFPTVTIADKRYMDGGVRSSLNADLAIGNEAVVVVSVTVLAVPAGVSDPFFEQAVARLADELDALRAADARLGVIEPAQEFLDISGWGLELMNSSRVPAAMEAGVRQGEQEAPRLGSIWDGGS
jgi:NTE family protein